MNKLIATLSVATLLVACGQSADTPQPEAPAEAAAKAGKIFDIPYLERDLDNGLRVVIVPTDYPNIVTIQIPVQTGSRNEVEAGKTGFAHFFEHMMFRGTEKYPADVYADILKKAGADQNAYTSSDLTNYHITFTKEDLEKVIEIEADRFQNLSYSEDVFRTEALAVKGEYLKNFSNPFSKMYERLSDLMFSKHTYKHTTMGFIEDIEAMPDQLEYSKIFFDRWYRPEKTTVILVGDLDAEATFALVKKYWGDWERGDYEIDVPVEPPLGGPKYEHLQWEGPTQPWFVLAFRGPAYVPTEKDMPALDLISQIYFSESSDLYRQLVLEDQSVDQLFPWFPDRKDPGMLVIAARLTDASHATDVRDKIYRTLAEARTQIVPEEKVEETKSRLRYSFTAGMDSSGNIGSILASFAHFDRNIEYINDVYATYDSLTAEDIRTVANKYFIDASRVTLSLSSDESMAGIDGKHRTRRHGRSRIRCTTVGLVATRGRILSASRRRGLRSGRQERPLVADRGNDHGRRFAGKDDRRDQCGHVSDGCRFRRPGRQGNDASRGPGAQGQPRRLVRACARPAAVPGLVGKRFFTHQDADEERHSHEPRRQ
jgi:zinc protease